MFGIRRQPREISTGLGALCPAHGSKTIEKNEALMRLWAEIRGDKRHHVIVAEEEGRLASTCVCLIVPNLTHGGRPYGLIENVVTDEAFRGRGLATACLNYAREIAERENCYKLMLLTGSKRESTLRFYENAGYDRSDKTGFVLWLKP
jgi:GNAT superfamily N-acetyltransferase